MPPKKNHLPNFPTPKNPGIKNFQPQKIIFLSLSLEIRSTPQPPKGSNFKALTGKIWVFSICSHLWQVVAYKRWLHVEVRLYKHCLGNEPVLFFLELH